MRVIVTRPLREAGRWIDGIRDAGFDAQTIPLIDIAPATDTEPVKNAWDHLKSYDAVMFVSANAANHFFDLKPASAPSWISDISVQTRAYVTGPGTASALRAIGMQPERVDSPHPDARQFDSEGLWLTVRGQIREGFRLLVVRGQGANGLGRDWFAEKVKAAGGVVEEVVAYKRCLPVWDQAQSNNARSAADDGSVWMFSSSEAISNLVSLCPGQSWVSARAVTTHPRIAESARNAGFGVVHESRPVLANLLASIESLE